MPLKKIHKNGKNPKFEKIYKNISVKNILDFPYDVVIVEDSKSGFQFYMKATENCPLECISSKGKSAIIKLLNRYDKKRILVIADAAALGSEIRDLLQYKSESDNRIDFFLPESFEWLILRSAIFYNNNDIQKILSDPVEHIECQEYFSWERFFTALLVSSTKDKINLEYHKDKNRLPSGYLSETNINKILNAMKNN